MKRFLMQAGIRVLICWITLLIMAVAFNPPPLLTMIITCLLTQIAILSSLTHYGEAQ